MAYAQTELLAPQTAAGYCNSFQVADIPVTLSLYASDGKISYGVQCPVLRKKGAGWEPAMDENGPVFLTAQRTEVSFFSPGEFKAHKPATSEALGFVKDTA